jgi:hypothetical protein
MITKTAYSEFLSDCEIRIKQIDKIQKFVICDIFNLNSNIEIDRDRYFYYSGNEKNIPCEDLTENEIEQIEDITLNLTLEELKNIKLLALERYVAGIKEAGYTSAFGFHIKLTDIIKLNLADQTTLVLSADKLGAAPATVAVVDSSFVPNIISFANYLQFGLEFGQKYQTIYAFHRAKIYEIQSAATIEDLQAIELEME